MINLMLLDIGYAHQHFEADWEDIGDGESGPLLAGGPGYHEYTSSDDVIYMSLEGKFMECVRRCWIGGVI